MNKVLIVTYYWPPGSGAGVQRWLKFSKYLPKYGWEPVILTVDPDFASYAARDDSLNKEIPENLSVYKTGARDYFRLYNKDKSKIPSAGFAIDEEKNLAGFTARFIRGNFFIPDPRRGWNRNAFVKACEIIESQNITRVITTSPPHSTQLIGLKLKKKFPDILWIADLRDPWTDIYYYEKFHPTFLSRMIDRRYEKSVLKYADKIITVGKSLKKLFNSKLPGIEGKTEVITNGYDDNDFMQLKPSKPDIFSISYIGTLPDSYPVNGFINALKMLSATGKHFRLKFIGFVSPRQKEKISSAFVKSQVEFINYVDHATAIRYMLDSSALLLIIPDHRSSHSIITGKLFEYIAAKKSVICLGPVDGDAAEIVESHSAGRTFGYYEVKSIFDYLNQLTEEPGLSPVKVSELSREYLTGLLAGVLNS
jgi:glycosyltransferase involved in cell wall biosynthesis